MAGFKTTNIFQRLALRVKMWIYHRRKMKEGKAINEAAHRTRALTGGVWMDNDGYLYNCLGQRIGKLISDEEEGV